MNIQENNKLIAEFMGMELSPITLEQFRKLKQRDKHLIKGSFVEDLCYHTSWDWIMPVVEKCKLNSNEEDSFWELIHYSLTEVNINSVYSAVVQFIHWYNEQNK